MQAQFPDAVDYHLAATARVPLEDLLNWAPPGKSTTIYDRACRPIRVERGDDALFGSVNPQSKVEGDRKTVHDDEIVVGRHIVVTCGSDRYYRRGRNGRWVLDGEGATGCVGPVGPPLSKVTPSAAWYNHEIVQLAVTCTEKLHEEAPCVGGGTRRCTRCLKWVVHAKNVGLGGVATTAKVSEPADCSVSCAPSSIDESARRASSFLEGREFLAEGREKHPFLFRTRAACAQYQRQLRDGNQR